jgi:hypothetical protein
MSLLKSLIGPGTGTGLMGTGLPGTRTLTLTEIGPADKVQFDGRSKDQF